MRLICQCLDAYRADIDSPFHRNQAKECQHLRLTLPNLSTQTFLLLSTVRANILQYQSYLLAVRPIKRRPRLTPSIPPIRHATLPLPPIPTSQLALVPTTRRDEAAVGISLQSRGPNVRFCFFVLKIHIRIQIYKIDSHDMIWETRSDPASFSHTSRGRSPIYNDWGEMSKRLEDDTFRVE